MEALPSLEIGSKPTSSLDLSVGLYVKSDVVKKTTADAILDAAETSKPGIETSARPAEPRAPTAGAPSGRFIERDERVHYP
jgi:hypothetical protein